MIDELEIRNVALIENASISPSPRMTAITGETGSGKTALLTACRMIMGARSDKDIVREGTEEAEASALLYLDPEAEETVVVRQVRADGRSKARVNGRMASAAELSELVAPTISLCSQHDQVSLVRPSVQMDFLDVYGSIRESQAFSEYMEALEAEREAAQRLEELRSEFSDGMERLEDAKYVARQIGAVAPSEEDYRELIDALSRAENAELLARTSSEAHDALSGESGVLDLLNAAIALLDDGAAADPSFKAYSAPLRDALFMIEDVARDIGRLDDAFEFDAASVGLMQDRVSAYQSLMRTYGPALEDVLARQREASELIASHEDADGILEAAENELAHIRSRLRETAARLHDLRTSCAEEFSDAISRILSELGMGSASFACEVAMTPPGRWGDSGPDEIVFMFSPASGVRPHPLSKIASGGELSRVVLALNAVLGRRGGTSTLVFDEVDTGIGGKTAGSMAKVLSDLAEGHQVIIVTHSAQIAAAADKHYRVSKFEEGDSVHTEIVEIDGDERIREIARMLSGGDTDISLDHARQLLKM